MKFKLIGIIVGKNRTNQGFNVINVPDYAREIPINTNVKVGFSINFSSDFIIQGWKYKKGKSIVSLVEQTPQSVFRVEPTTPSVPVDFSLSFTSQGKRGLETYSSFNEKGIFIQQNLLKKISKRKYFEDELIGYQIINDENQELIGSLKECIFTKANDVWFIKTNKGDLPIPILDDVIAKIDNRKKIVFVNIQPGLLELLNEN